MADVSLDPHDERLVQDLVASGRYRDETEVVREGLRLLEDRLRKIAQLRKEIQDAIEEGGRFTEDEVRASLAATLADRPPSTSSEDPSSSSGPTRIIIGLFPHHRRPFRASSSRRRGCRRARRVRPPLGKVKRALTARA